MKVGQLRGFGEGNGLDAMAAGEDGGVGVNMPSTSVQIWISGADARATIEAVKSEPPRPRVVATLSMVEPMNPAMTTTEWRASGGMVAASRA